MRLLLLSNSTNAGQSYLQHALQPIQSFLGAGSSEVLFIPYAGITISQDEYVTMVRKKFMEINVRLTAFHPMEDPVKAVENARAIAVGGGNTFQLLKLLQASSLLDPIRERVRSGIPFIGWSAGANVACPTIRTTNDMPVVQPATLDALGLIPFQINPHYLDRNPDGHAGETREMRISEFLELNPSAVVVGLREGTMLLLEGQKLSLLGDKPARVFRKGVTAFECYPGADLQFLMTE